MKVTIFGKLLMGFGAMLLLASFLGWVGLYSLSEVKGRIGKAVHKYAQLQSYVKQIRDGLLEARGSEKDFLIKGERKYVNQVRERIGKIKEGCRKLSALGFEGRTWEIAAFADEYYKGFLQVADRMEEKLESMNEKLASLAGEVSAIKQWMIGIDKVINGLRGAAMERNGEISELEVNLERLYADVLTRRELVVKYLIPLAGVLATLLGVFATVIVAVLK